MSEDAIDTRQQRRLLALGHALGVPVRSFLGYFGDHALMLGQAVTWLFRPPFRIRPG